MAEAAIRHALAARGVRADVGSAGIDAIDNEPAHPLSVATVKVAGVGDLTMHRSRLVSPLMVRSADMVLCMEHMHRDALVGRVPDAAGRVRLLGHWQGIEIEDPVNGPAPGYVQCLELMRECIDQWLDRLDRQGLLQ